MASLMMMCPKSDVTLTRCCFNFHSPTSHMHFWYVWSRRQPQILYLLGLVPVC